MPLAFSPAKKGNTIDQADALSRTEPIVFFSEADRCRLLPQDMRLQASLAVVLSAQINVAQGKLQRIKEAIDEIGRIDPVATRLPNCPHLRTYIVTLFAKESLLATGWREAPVAEWRVEQLVNGDDRIQLSNYKFDRAYSDKGKRVWESAALQAEREFDVGKQGILAMCDTVAPTLATLLREKSDWHLCQSSELEAIVARCPDEINALIVSVVSKAV